MSQIVIEGPQPLGQDPIVQPQPITYIEGKVYAGLQDFWQNAREQCEQRFTPAQCQALLGVRPTILEPFQRKADAIAWYWLVGIGVVIGKVVL